MKNWLSVFLIVSLGIICYGNIYKNEFIFDDPDIILNNKAIHDITNLKAVLASDYWHDQANSGLYRPLVFLTFAIDYFFWGSNPVGYHIVNIAFHLAVCLVLFFVARAFFLNLACCFIASVLFAIHPAHVEAVTGIVGRAEVLSALFFCLSWLFFIKSYSQSGFSVDLLLSGICCIRIIVYFLLSALCYFLALASKENSFVLPAVIFCTLWYFEKSLKKQQAIKILLILAPYLLMFSLYFFIRYMVIGSIGPVGTEQFFYNKPGHVVFYTMNCVLAWYFKLLLIPTGLLCSYRHWALSASIFEIKVIISIMINVILIISGILFFKYKTSWRFFLLFILITLLPVSNIIRFGDIMAERFAYLPSVGFCVILAIFFTKLLFSKSVFNRVLFKTRSLFIYFIVIAVCLSLLCLKRNYQWRDGIIFWKTAIRDIPKSYSAYYNLAYTYYEKGYKKKAVETLKKSLDINPSHNETRRFLCKLYYSSAKYDEAIFQGRILLKVDGYSAESYTSLALPLMKKGKYDEAINVCLQGIDKVGGKPEIYNTMVRLYLNMNKPDEALKIVYKSLKADINNIDSHIKAGECYEKLNNNQSAKKHYMKALAIDSKNFDALDKLALLYFRDKDYSHALKMWEAAIKYYPSNDYIWYYIGICREKMGDIETAISSWRNIAVSKAYGQRALEKINKYIKHN